MGTLPHVLVVDESWYRRWKICGALLRLPASIEVASDGVAALTRAEMRRPDAVLINLEGKHLDGRELRRRMLADRRLATVPAVSYSWIRRTPRAEGFNDHLAARFAETELHSALTDLFQQASISSTSPLRRHRVLIVDDEDYCRLMFAAWLWRTGLLIETARDGEEALQKMRFRKPDILVLDHIMPGMNGWEVWRRMQSEPGMASVKVIALLSRGTDKVVFETWRLGIGCYLIKPFHRLELETYVKRMLE